MKIQTPADLLPAILGPQGPSTPNLEGTPEAPVFSAASARRYLERFEAKDETLETARDLIAQFMADMFNFREPYCLALLGPSGTGKTTLARLVVAFFHRFMVHLQDPGLTDGIWRCSGGFVDWGVALRTMLDTGEWRRMGNYRGDFFVVLDDIMAEHEKLRELSASKLFDILNARHGRRWTIVNANCSKDTIATKLDARIASRLIRDGSMCFEMPMQTPDYALRR